MRGRFAPSPTGSLHVGNLRTALIAWLCARAAGSEFLLRIDDLDPERSKPEYEHAQLADLARLQITFDGKPIRQSERMDRYYQALKTLNENSLTYPCFCSRAEVLQAASAPHKNGVEAPYPGTCSHLSARSAQRRIDLGEAHCLRARAAGSKVSFTDQAQGPVTQRVDDFVLRRRDGVPAYNLASPIDESDMAVEEVVRGADLTTNTPRQIWVARHLGLSIPQFRHLPIVLSHDAKRFSKRSGAVDLSTLMSERGIDQVSVFRIIAGSLNSAVTNPMQASTPADLLDGFDPDRLPRESWTFHLK